MKYEKACGGVIYFKEENNYYFLTIQSKFDSHWGFPKGHVEKGETEEETALREVYEEAGLEVKFIEGFRCKVEYSPKEGIWKEVVFFLAESAVKDVKCQIEEIVDYKWLKLEQCIEILNYSENKYVLKEAYDFIKDKYDKNK